MILKHGFEYQVQAHGNAVVASDNDRLSLGLITLVLFCGSFVDSGNIEYGGLNAGNTCLLTLDCWSSNHWLIQVLKTCPLGLFSGTF